MAAARPPSWCLPAGPPRQRHEGECRACGRGWWRCRSPSFLPPAVLSGPRPKQARGVWVRRAAARDRCPRDLPGRPSGLGGLVRRRRECGGAVSGAPCSPEGGTRSGLGSGAQAGGRAGASHRERPRLWQRRPGGMGGEAGTGAEGAGIPIPRRYGRRGGRLGAWWLPGRWALVWPCLSRCRLPLRDAPSPRSPVGGRR